MNIASPARAAALVLLVSLAGCPTTPESCPDTSTDTSTAAAAWGVVRDESTLPGVVLSVWGAAPDSVFFAGGPLGDSGSSLALHYACGQWKDLSPGGPETFWWVSGSGPDDVWFVGEKGRIAHYDGAKTTDVPSGQTVTLWGAFAFGPDDAWAVGGTPDAMPGTPNDIVIHWDGKAWTQETLPGTPLGVSLFKVWGTSDDDLYVVGERGTIWHRTKAGWVFEGGAPPLTKSRLFTVNGCSSDDVFAVGGDAVLHRDASGWSKVDVALGNQVNGVACGPSGKAAIVGFGGLKQRLVDGQWINEFGSEPYSDLHATWADGKGVFWAVGGDFVSPGKPGVTRKGVIARFGPPLP